MVTVPRLLNLFIKPDKVYPLYGFHYRIHRAIARMTNMKFFKHLFGDSSYIVHYLRCLGYNLSQVVQTGSNFGTEVGHETPYLSSVGSGTMVADGLSIINADFSSTSFRVSRASIGPNNFLGNNIAYPAGRPDGRQLPARDEGHGPDRRGGPGGGRAAGLAVLRDSALGRAGQPVRPSEDRGRAAPPPRRQEPAQPATMGVFLLVRWLHVFLVTVFAPGRLRLLRRVRAAGDGRAWSRSASCSPRSTSCWWSARSRAFRPLRPRYCSIYDPYFWRHERLWKMPGEAYLHIFNGTPFKNVIWRLLGVRIGRRVFDDGCYLTERTLATIGDDCTLNAGSKIQCHSQEDGTFKSDRITIGAGCTLGVGALVHYGVTMGDGSVLAPDSFLMKGEEIPPRARWGGNPAREM